MKNKLLSIFGAMLFSCHPVYADVNTTDITTFGKVQETPEQVVESVLVQKEYCNSLANMADSVMQARQNGIPKVTLDRIIPQSDTETKILIEKVVEVAYDVPKYQDSTMKSLAAERYAVLTFKTCMGV